MENLCKIEISRIKVGKHEQRASEDDEQFNELCNSIGQIGLINPIIVTADGDYYNLVAGHRRIAACKRLGFREIDCILREPAGAVDAEITFAENFCRRNLTALEQACAINDCYKNGVMTVEQMARAFHRSENWIAAQIGMLDWPEDVLQAIHLDLISVSAARNLAMIDDDSYRAFLLDNAVGSGATARATAAWLQAWRSSRPAEEAVTAELPAGSPPQAPLVPQAPCLSCGQVHRMDHLSHVPMCQECIHIIRGAGQA